MRVTLSLADLSLLTEALDSHEYWQLTDEAFRNDGYSQVDDGNDEDIDACRALYKRLNRLIARLMKHAVVA